MVSLVLTPQIQMYFNTTDCAELGRFRVWSDRGLSGGFYALQSRILSKTYSEPPKYCTLILRRYS